MWTGPAILGGRRSRGEAPGCLPTGQELQAVFEIAEASRFEIEELGAITDHSRRSHRTIRALAGLAPGAVEAASGRLGNAADVHADSLGSSSGSATTTAAPQRTDLRSRRRRLAICEPNAGTTCVPRIRLAPGPRRSSSILASLGDRRPRDSRGSTRGRPERFARCRPNGQLMKCGPARTDEKRERQGLDQNRPSTHNGGAARSRSAVSRQEVTDLSQGAPCGRLHAFRRCAPG